MVQPLVSSASTPPTSPSHASVLRFRPPTPAVIMTLLWSAVVGASYGIVTYGGLALGTGQGKEDKHGILYTILGVTMTVSALQVVFYPVGGLIADIWCGRYRVVMASMIKICCGYGLLLVATVLMATSKIAYTIDDDKNGKAVTYTESVVMGLSALLFVVGFSGFQANVVQFGLDQLLDAPSERLSWFLHWFVWSDTAGQTLITVIASPILCTPVMAKVAMFSPTVLFLVAGSTVLISCCKARHGRWFHREPHTQNPYGTVYRVLRFTASHSKPLLRSAFTYCDDERPTRLDFAKERFGGPFPTETVEDVKTFLRILIMLLAVGPTYAVHVSVRYLFPLYGIHTVSRSVIHYENAFSCDYVNWLVFASGCLSYVVSVVFLPLYIALLPCTRRHLPRILVRLGVGLTLLLLADLSMALTQLGRHYHHQHQHYLDTNTTHINSSCMFLGNIASVRRTAGLSGTLGLPSWLLLFPNLLTGVAVPLTYITILEFISAQSPHAMKGVLLGGFYAVRGLFTVAGCVLVFPFAGEETWRRHEGSLFDCGLSYYVFSVLVGVVGVGLFCVAARWYKYRVRGDQPYGPKYVEEYYQRYIGAGAQRTLANTTSIADYGAM